MASGVEVDIDAERAQHVGGARSRRQRAVAVLGDRHAGAGDDEGRAGRDVEGARGIAAGADHVDGVGRRVDRAASWPACGDRAGDFVHRLAAHAQRHQQARPFARASLRRTSCCRRPIGGLLAAERRARRDFADQRLEFTVPYRPYRSTPAMLRRMPRRCAPAVATFHSAAMSRKFFSIRWPCSEAMLSGWNCTPCTGKRRCAQAHDEAVAGLGRHRKVARHARAVDHERMIARRLERRVDAAEYALATMADRPRACRAPAPAPARPCRRTLGRSPGGRGRRRRSGSSARPSRSGRGRCRLRWACTGRATARSHPDRRRLRARL